MKSTGLRTRFKILALSISKLWNLEGFFFISLNLLLHLLLWRLNGTLCSTKYELRKWDLFAVLCFFLLCVISLCRASETGKLGNLLIDCIYELKQLLRAKEINNNQLLFHKTHGVFDLNYPGLGRISDKFTCAWGHRICIPTREYPAGTSHLNSLNSQGFLKGLCFALFIF